MANQTTQITLGIDVAKDHLAIHHWGDLLFHRGVFASVDAFIAFIGMDLQQRQSGAFKGRAKLSKRGEAELRRLLYCAAQPARSHPPFDHYYQQQLDKGLSKTAAKVILARKLARIAFALICKKESFRLA